jgi:hypothetical protein
MFWRKKAVEAGTPAMKAEPPKVKAKKLSPRDTIRQKIEQLTAGEVLRYKFPETFGGNLAVIELNPRYPQKGHKYILSTEKLVGGKPAGKKSQLFDSNNPSGLASWIMERMGELFVVAEKGSEEPTQAEIAATKQPPAPSSAS